MARRVFDQDSIKACRFVCEAELDSLLHLGQPIFLLTNQSRLQSLVLGLNCLHRARIKYVSKTSLEKLMQGQRVLSAVMEYLHRWTNHQISQDLFCVLNTLLVIIVSHF